ncbi:MAG: flagellar hook protein FlgE [Balneolales bacterium]
MALIRALNSGVSGLKSFQAKMDVIGNNIANVETAGFKSSRVTFAELMNQRLGRTDSGGESSPQMENQVGLGVRIASIDRDYSQGVMQNTGKGTDLALEGKGFFLVQDQGQNFMTRAGNFVFNKDGQLVDQGGRFVQGYNADSDGNIQGGGATRNITVDFENVFPPRQTDEVIVGGNLSGEEGTTRVLSTTAYDSLGNAHSLVMEFTRTANENEWDYEVSFPDGGTVGAGQTGTVEFDSNGNISSSSVIAITNFDPESGANVFDLDIHLGSADQGVSFTQFAGANNAKVIAQNGHTEGRLLDIAIDGDGRLQGIYDNGRNQTLSQIAIAQVQNENGLEMMGSGLFRTTSAAGEVFVGSAESLAGTSVNSGALEGSNVDLAKEFTEMITSQRAYQSNARVISTSDEMLMEAVNLKR